MLIALDAGHGGSDPGAVYNGRQEKDDNLALAKAVGDILEQRGLNVVYTRTNDIYETPFKKATEGNEAGADYFVSFHRNSSETPEKATGVQTLIYSKGGAKERLANVIQNNLVDLGFKDLGVVERPNLVVLKRTKMPAVLIETGFINNSADNEKFDSQFQEIARAIADGIIEGIGYGEEVSAKVMQTEPDENTGYYSEYEETDPYRGLSEKRKTPIMWEEEKEPACVCEKLYRVQVGAFRVKENAERLLSSLTSEGFPAFIIYNDPLYKVQVGAYKKLDNAVKTEQRLRRFRYNTFITT